MAFLSNDALNQMGFKYLGNNVKISDRAAIHNAKDISIGHNSRIDDFCVIAGKVNIGNNVHIAVFCNIAGGTEGITFDDFSGLAYGCHVFSQSDDYLGRTLTNPTVPAQFKMETKKPVHIGRHCIVGTSSLIFPGVHLAEGCSVGAMSMVTKSTEEWMIYSGVPAKKLKSRRKELLELEQQYLAMFQPGMSTNFK
jgi:acetyltransferase-like isoleucine patch superfamily enzyme